MRAIVEEGRFAIDSYLIYLKNETNSFLRVRLNQGEFELDGKNYALAWPDATGNLVPASGSVNPNTNLVSVEQIGVTGDVASAKVIFTRLRPRVLLYSLCLHTSFCIGPRFC